MNRGTAEQALPCGTLSFDDDGRILGINAVLRRWLQLGEADLTGQSITRLLGPAARVFYSSHLFPMLKLHGHVEELYFPMRAADGTDVPLLANAVRQPGEGGAGSVNRIACLTMWQRHQLERALVEARKTAEDATLAKDQFIAQVSHDLRSPLSAIVGWVRLLRTGKANEAMTERGLEAIERNASAQAQLVDDLLDVSRIVSGKLRLSPRAMELSDVIVEGVDTCRPAAKSKGVDLHVVLQRPSGSVLADPQRIRQIVWNLVSNAIKFTPKGGHVQVLLQTADSKVRLQVSDDGQGIAAEEIPFLFERFWRAEGASRAEKTGLGLGLAITRSLVEMHGGTISAVSSGVGFGSSFIVELPLALTQAPPPVAMPGPPRDSAQPAASDALEGVRCLVVDDDEDTRTMLALLLRAAGAKVEIAGSVASALQIAGGTPVDIVLSDVGMPGEDGYALIRQLRGHANAPLRRVPAVAVTGLSRPQDRVQLLRAGFQALLVKPVEPTELVALTASLTGHLRVK
jgi:signal transduction histidine kinase/CheY-like chemotaxis protein